MMEDGGWLAHDAARPLQMPKHHQIITFPPACFTDGFRQASVIFSQALHFILFTCNQKTSNFDMVLVRKRLSVDPILVGSGSFTVLIKTST